MRPMIYLQYIFALLVVSSWFKWWCYVLIIFKQLISFGDWFASYHNEIWLTSWNWDYLIQIIDEIYGCKIRDTLVSASSYPPTVPMGKMMLLLRSFLPIPCQPARARQAESAVRPSPSSLPPRQSDISHEMRFWVVVCKSEANGWSLSQLKLARCTDIISYLGYKIDIIIWQYRILLARDCWGEVLGSV